MIRRRRRGLGADCEAGFCLNWPAHLGGNAASRGDGRNLDAEAIRASPRWAQVRCIAFISKAASNSHRRLNKYRS